MNRLQSIEDRLSSLDDIQGLSELLSIKYNPFLDLDEEELFERRHDPQSLVEAQVADRRRDPVRSFRDHRVEREREREREREPEPGPEPGPRPWPEHGRRDRDDAWQHDEASRGTGREVLERETAGRDAAQRRREALAAPERAPALLSGNPDTLFHGRTAVTPGGARESFLAMHWFTYLSEGTDSSIIFLYLDYYHYVGWIDESSYRWLARLAEGVAKRRDGAGWSDYGMDVQRLSNNHLRNLRFLDKMLGTTLQHGEADYLRQTVDMLLMEDG